MRKYLASIITAALMGSVLTGSVAFASEANPTAVKLEQEKLAMLAAQGFKPWVWLESDCADCELVIVGKAPALQTEKVQKFIGTIETHKSELIRLYEIHGAEYNLLAKMAVGILGRESEFFESPRYKMKEALPEAVYLVKLLRAYWNGSETGPMPNSRGPTQIKVVPKKIAEHYGVTPETLYIPENAALATMGFLIESLGELKRRIEISHLDHINPSNYIDYLPYLYFGSKRALVNRTATPETNIYIRDMRRYMSWIEMYERAPEPTYMQGSPQQVIR